MSRFEPLDPTSAASQGAAQVGLEPADPRELSGDDLSRLPRVTGNESRSEWAGPGQPDGSSEATSFPRSSSGGDYPLAVELSCTARVARWRPLVNWALVIPSLLWLTTLQFGAAAGSVVAWVAILVSGRMPARLGDYLVGVLRYRWRIVTYLYGLTDHHPGLRVPAGYVDPGDSTTANPDGSFWHGVLGAKGRIVIWVNYLNDDATRPQVVDGLAQQQWALVGTGP